MTAEPKFTFLGECPPFPARTTNKGRCKYPFEKLQPGHGLDVKGRSFSSVKAAVRRWLENKGSGEQFKLRTIGDVVRVRRES